MGGEVKVISLPQRKLEQDMRGFADRTLETIAFSLEMMRRPFCGNLLATVLHENPQAAADFDPEMQELLQLFTIEFANGNRFVAGYAWCCQRCHTLPAAEIEDLLPCEKFLTVAVMCIRCGNYWRFSRSGLPENITDFSQKLREGKQVLNSVLLMAEGVKIFRMEKGIFLQ